MKDIIGTVYTIKNKTNHRFYLGYTNDFIYAKRKHIYYSLSKSDNSKIHRLIRFYGINTFEWKILVGCEFSKIKRVYNYYKEQYDNFLRYKELDEPFLRDDSYFENITEDDYERYCLYNYKTDLDKPVLNSFKKDYVKIDRTHYKKQDETLYTFYNKKLDLYEVDINRYDMANKYNLICNEMSRIIKQKAGSKGWKLKDI